ncbi:MAG TPA: PAS domain S-box protein [Thermodesulfovibrionales bacterium]|nr:PAS domain S-box protein [Thermodesulfovibrionales bacterium]
MAKPRDLRQEFKDYFEYTPIPLWLEDLSGVRNYFDELLKKGVSDFRTYLTLNKEAVLHCLSLVKILDVNNEAVRLYHAQNKKELMENLEKVFTPESISGFREALIALAEGISGFEVDTINKTLDGQILSVALRFTTVPEAIKDFSQIIVSVVDMTARRASEEALRESERQLAESQRVAELGSWEWNIVENKVTWSEGSYRLFGVTPETFGGAYESFLKMVHPEDRAYLDQEVRRSVSEHRPYNIDVRILRPSGEEWIMYAKGGVIYDDSGKPVRMRGVLQDITWRKKAEQELLFYHEVFEKSNDSIFIVDGQSGSFLDINEKACISLGYDRDELLKKGIQDIEMKLQDIASVRRHLGDVLSQGSAFFEGLHRRKDGTTFPVEMNVKAVEYLGKTYIVGIAHDLTERKNNEAALRASEEFIRTILDTVDEGIIVIDRDFRILSANRAYCRQVGRVCEEIIGKHCYEISHRVSRPCYEENEECAVRRVFATGQPQAVMHSHVDHDGYFLFVETKGYPIKDASGNVTSVIETINNITEKRLLEEERLKTQKLESIGTLAGGIAHDFNNLLQGIFGYISMAKMSLDRQEKSYAMLEQAESALHQSISLTMQLLTFSKGGKPIKKRISLLPVIESSAKFALSGSQSGLELDIAPDLWQVDADSGQLGQVIQNIVLNADHAMPEGGTILVAAKNVMKPDSRHPQLTKSRYVEISVRDEGIGIPEKYLQKIFDPYFTTKEKGSGLGLATSYSIIRNHGGIIHVTSELGKGTTFFIYLPAIKVNKDYKETFASSSVIRTGKILVMDDDTMVRNLAEELIKALGHEVELARHGESAVQKYQAAIESGKPFDIVILDLTIRGGMGGKDTIERLLAIDPDVKAIVSTGYSDDDAMADYEKCGFKARLLKPYRLNDLRDALNKTLSQ